MTIDTSTEAVERLLEDVTPGPWRVRVNKRDSHDECDLSICGDIFVLADLNGPQYLHQHPNAHFIAAARDLVPALLKERDEARARAAAAFEMAADCAAPQKKRAKLRGGGLHTPAYRDKGETTAIQVRRQIAKNIRALATDQERDALARVRAEAMREAADAVEDYCSDMPDLAGHGHSVGLKDTFLARADQIEK